MATVTLSRSDLYPVGTVVGIYPAQARRGDNPPSAAVIATGTVDAAGNLSVTNAGIASYTGYVAYAQVNGEHRYARLRSTVDAHDYGTATFTANTTNGSAALASATVSAGALAIGQRVTGPGIRPGTFLISGSGASWTMSDTASATATGAALLADGGSVPVTDVGATPVPVRGPWRSRVMQRRSLQGTS